jgi:hypothetical protein
MRKITSKLTFTGGYIINLAKPVNTALPTISGTVQVGQTLSAFEGTWTNSPASYAYQWADSGTGAIRGATASTYVPVEGDVGGTLTVTVMASNSSGAGIPAVSAATGAVFDIIPVNTVLPAISGIPQVGQPLTATTGTWTHNPVSYSYQWNHSGTAIGGATASTYVPVPGDIGDTLTVHVAAKNSGGSSAQVVSAKTGAVSGTAGVPMNTVLPAISGTAQVGQTLTASAGTWTNSPASYANQWQNEGSPIAGATSATYIIQASDLGALITLQVIATNSAGASIPAVSPLGTPVISTTVFYVSQSTGNDSNAGTLAAPWQTVAKVNAQNFAPGTSVLFKRGDVWRVNDFDGHQLSPLPNVLSGSAGNPIVFDAYGAGPNPVLQGSVAASHTTDWTNIGTNLWQSVKTFPPIVQPGNLSGLNGLPNNNANDVGNIIWNSGGTTFVGVETGSNFTGSPGLAASPTAQGQWQFITAAGAGQWTVQVYSVGNPATVMPGLELVQDKSLIVAFQIDHVVFQNFTLQYSGASTIATQSSSNLVFRDIDTLWNGGGNLGGGGTRYGDTLDLEGTFHDILVERLNIFEQYDSGLTIQGGGLNGGVPVHADNVTFRNNIICNTGNPLFAQMNPSTAGSTMNNFHVYNNSSYSPLQWSVGQRPNGNAARGLVLQIDPSLTMTGTVFENNIISNDTVFSITMPTYTSYEGNYTQDYNLWFGTPGSGNQPTQFVKTVGGFAGKNVSDWAASYLPPQEGHGLIDINPGYTSPATGNLVPLSTSPVRSIGVNLYGAGVVWDFNKNPRPASGPFTIGAFE